MHSLAKTGQTSSALGVLHWMRGIACFALSMCLAQAATAQLRYAGSDTVEPMIEAAQVSFARGHAGYKLQIQANGTSAGFRELCTGRAALIGASRPIKPDEAQTCATANIQQIEVPMALDAIVLVASTKNNWLKELTFAEVRTLFDPASTSKLTSWKQLRPGFPDAPIKTAGVGIKHGTFRQGVVRVEALTRLESAGAAILQTYLHRTLQHDQPLRRGGAVKRTAETYRARAKLKTLGWF